LPQSKGNSGNESNEKAKAIARTTVAMMTQKQSFPWQLKGIRVLTMPVKRVKIREAKLTMNRAGTEIH
jgi:hypothetical protein